MGTGSALPEDPTALLGIELTPSERFQRLADTLHAQQDGASPSPSGRRSSPTRLRPAKTMHEAPAGEAE